MGNTDADSTPPGSGTSGLFYFTDSPSLIDRAFSGVLNGMKVTKHAAVANMSVDIAAGTYRVSEGRPGSGGVAAAVALVSSYAGGTATITTADANFPRLDGITINASGTVTVWAGTPSSTPTPGFTQAGGVGTDLLLALVLVNPAASAIQDRDIYDRSTRVNVVYTGNTNSVVTAALTTPAVNDLLGIDASGNLAKMTTSSGIVRVTSGSVGAQELSGDVTTSLFAATIENDAVSNAKLANMAAHTFKGNNTGSTGDPADLTRAQMVAELFDSLSSTQGAVLYRGASAWTALAPGTSGQVLQTQGSSANPQWAAASSGGVTVYARSTGLTYNNDSTERTIFSFTLNANDLSTNKTLQFRMGGNMSLNNGTVSLTVKVKLGSTTLWGSVTPTLGLSGTRRAWELIFTIGNLGATNSQGCYGFFHYSSAAAGSVAGLGSIAASGTAIGAEGVFSGTATEDTTTNLTAAVTFQLSVANAVNEIVMYDATAELV